MNDLVNSICNYYGEEVRSSVTTLDELVKDYIESNFPTRDANSELINKSFSQLKKIYDFTLSKTGVENLALFRFLIHKFSENQNNAFNITRINFMPVIPNGGNHSDNEYVADINQLFVNLAKVSTANELRKLMRLDDIYKNIRSHNARLSIETYISSIDI